MELYTAGTGNGQRTAIAVNECGVSCKFHVLNLGQGDQKEDQPDCAHPDPYRWLRDRSARSAESLT